MQIKNLFDSIRSGELNLEQFTAILKTEFDNCETYAYESMSDSLANAFDYFLLDNKLEDNLNLNAFVQASDISPEYFDNYIE